MTQIWTGRATKTCAWRRASMRSSLIQATFQATGAAQVQGMVGGRGRETKVTTVTGEVCRKFPVENVGGKGRSASRGLPASKPQAREDRRTSRRRQLESALPPSS